MKLPFIFLWRKTMLLLLNSACCVHTFYVFLSRDILQITMGSFLQEKQLYFVPLSQRLPLGRNSLGRVDDLVLKVWKLKTKIWGPPNCLWFVLETVSVQCKLILNPLLAEVVEFFVFLLLPLECWDYNMFVTLPSKAFFKTCV